MRGGAVTIYRMPPVGAAEAAALDRIAMLRRELRFQVAEPRRWVGTVRRVLAARAIQGSNSIEGINVSVEDALAAVDGEDAVVPRGPTRTRSKAIGGQWRTWCSWPTTPTSVTRLR